MKKRVEAQIPEVDTGQLFSEPYNLAETSPDALPGPNKLREDWIDSLATGNPFYIVDRTGQAWHISVDPTGQAISLFDVYQTWVPGTGHLRYSGPDAWDTLLENVIGYHYTVVDWGHGLATSNVQAHYDHVHNPVWFRVVQKLVENHYAAITKQEKNPYK
jgi:hypothetical protein